ncbi:Rne/Rng family ribonuclease [Nocardioides ultimimeridianus]
MTDAPIDNSTDVTTEQAPDAPAAESAEAPKKKAPAKKTAAKKAPAKKAAAKKAPAKKAAPAESEGETAEAKPAKKAPAKKAAAKKAPAKKAAAAKAEAPQAPEAQEGTDEAGAPAVLFQVPEKTAAPRRTRKAVAPAPAPEADVEEVEETDEAEANEATEKAPAAKKAAKKAPAKKTQPKPAEAEQADQADQADPTEDDEAESGEDTEDDAEGETDGTGAPRRRRRRGGRRRRKPAGSGGNAEGDEAASDDAATAPGQDAAKDGGRDSNRDTSGDATKDAGKAEAEEGDDAEGGTPDGEGQGSSNSSRRRRRRRREGEGGGSEDGDDSNTVTRVRKPRSPEDEITSISGSTRLEAKKQRRRDGREAGRRRAPIVSEAEFLARRESVERVMVIRQKPDLIQIGVLEDKVLVEHYVARESQTSLIGNVYLGRVQNVLPSMEAAFIDIGKGRNAVLYAGEVNWASLGWKEGTPRKIESVLTSGQTVLVQVSKDPIGHKGARLTSQVSLAGRFLVYVPDGTTSGISRKLPDTERARLKTLLKEIVPDTAGVIVRTAAEGASEEELTRDVERLKSRWEAIESKVAKGNSPQLLYGEPDLTLKVVRDLFTEDFAKLVVQGDDAWKTVSEYVEQVAPDLTERLEKYDASERGADLFAAYRVDEQIAKGLDRKVWLPSGGSLVIDRTEAMTVVDVNTGKFTGSGGNLEETVTKNNLEAAEEIVRQLRLRDIGGIIVVDFIDMVLESNRDLVLRRLVECLGRDRTRHQVAEVTSLGLVQMTRKRIGTGLLEAFSENCSHCQGRGVIVHDMPIDTKRGNGGDAGGESGGGGGSRSGNRRRRGRGNAEQADTETTANEAPKAVPSPAAIAAMAMSHPPVATDEQADEQADATEATEGTGDVEAIEVSSETPAAEDVVMEAPADEEPVLEVPAAEEPVAEEPEVAEAPAAEEPAPAEEPAAQPEPAKPVVVTQVRRGGTSRTVQTAPAAAIVVSAEPEQPVESPVETPKPVVVTRTRRSSARPADVPADQDADGTEAADAGEPHALHVPVKKKGARKR